MALSLATSIDDDSTSSSMLWVDKYAPKRFNELLNNEVRINTTPTPIWRPSSATH